MEPFRQSARAESALDRLQTIELQQRIWLDQRAQELLAENQDFQRLIKLPGVAAITALTILAEAGDMRRFHYHRQSPSGGQVSARQKRPVHSRPAAGADGHRRSDIRADDARLIRGRDKIAAGGAERPPDDDRTHKNLDSRTSNECHIRIRPKPLFTVPVTFWSLWPRFVAIISRTAEMPR